jgi:uncharacterized protein YkwD
MSAPAGARSLSTEMTRIDHLKARRTVAIAIALATLAIVPFASQALADSGRVAGAAAAVGGSDGVCPDAERPANEATPLELRRSVRCLINLERAIRGKGKLKREKTLQKAALKHSLVMVEAECLAHRCGDEPTLAERIERSGYLDSADAWQFAESTGCGVSADAMVDNWMATKFHRINILEKTYIDVGVGVVQEPVDERCDTGYATFTVVFGWRTPEPEPSPGS